MVRIFKVAKEWKDKDINLPQRQTMYSAGYDFEAAEDVVVVPVWRALIYGLVIHPTRVPTGIKVCMENDEVLKLYNRSSSPIKRLLLFALGVGVVDADYYENPTNDGAISFYFWNFGLKEITIKKGERIGQGVFQKYLLADNDIEPETIRKGGYGSTGVE